jgi:3-hydroxybutyryl-CoA dehydrogenase
MAPPGGDAELRAAVVARLTTGGVKVTAIKDSPGFIAQRIRAMVANLGCELAQIGIASPADIDTAMTLGLNYPQGPLALADAMGPDTVLTILSRLQELSGDDRYRPSSWLRRRAQLGLSASESD